MPVLLVLLILVVAVLVWRRTSRKSAGPQLRPRHLGPDDDPDFLRELSKRPRRDDDLS